MDEKELKPCPFCGGTDMFVERLDYTACFVQCDSPVGDGDSCCMRGPIGVQEGDGEEMPGRDAAIRAWNQRAALPSDAAQAPRYEVSAGRKWNAVTEAQYDAWSGEKRINAAPVAPAAAAPSDETNSEFLARKYRESQPDERAAFEARVLVLARNFSRDYAGASNSNQIRAEIDFAKALREMLDRATQQATNEVEQYVLSVLPSVYYMDPPDGGSVTVLEQLRRMAGDAAKYRTLQSANVERATAKRDKEVLDLIDERDRCEEWADKLAEAIAVHLCIDVGEHSSANNPWSEALDALMATPTVGELTGATTPSPVAGSAGQAPFIYTENVSNEPLEVIRANECESGLSGLSESRFRRLWNELEQARAAPTAPSLTTDAGAVTVWKTTHPAVCVPLTEDREVADGWRAQGWPVIELVASNAEQRMSDAARDVLAERVRQINEEGWTPTHDDQHDDGELAAAAACYAVSYESQLLSYLWPWDLDWWKPTTPRRDLEKAGALILAEIERLDRAARKSEIERGGGK